MVKEAGNSLIFDQTKMFVASLLTISCFLSLLRIVLIIFRQRKDPIGKLYDEIDGEIGSRTTTTNYGSIF